jgi:hypothetical protein
MRWGIPAATPAVAAAGRNAATACGGAAAGSFGTAGAGFGAASGGAGRGAAGLFAAAFLFGVAFFGAAFRALAAFPARRGREAVLLDLLRPAAFFRGGFFATLRGEVFLRAACLRACLPRGRAAFFLLALLAFLRAAIVAPPSRVRWILGVRENAGQPRRIETRGRRH